MQWIIGDIHGCFHTLKALIDKVKKSDENAKFVFVGDYVDRGLHNKEVVDYVIEMQKNGAVCLRGNHDDITDFLLNGDCYSDINYFAGSRDISNVMFWWQRNGLEETLNSYGIYSIKYKRDAGPYSISMPDYYSLSEDFKNAVPEDHKEFFRNLPLYWENDTHFSCHAFYRPEEELFRDIKFIPGDRATESLWSRFNSYTHLKNVTKWDKIGVFGHTPVKYYNSVAPVVWDKIRLIDTGAFSDNYLCAYCCDTDDHILQATVKDDLLEKYL